MTFLEKIMEHSGITKVPRYAKESFGFRARVSASSEFHRIDGLPRRTWTETQTARTVDAVTEELKTPSGTMTLRDLQAQAIAECLMYEGGFFPIGVGGGKALISLLVPVVLKAKRPLLLVPAQVREQTNRIVIPEMGEHWNLHPNLKVLGYSELSLAKNANLLDELQPDLIIMDECHRARNKNAGRTRRLVRYFKTHPETRCVAMSGTISSRSLRDYAHILAWCLKGMTPVPMTWQELSDWADCVDEKVSEDRRVAPGALSKWYGPDENVRQGFRRRLTETPGVVASTEGALGTSLVISQFEGLEIPDVVQRAIDRMRATWETPNGDIITEAVELWRHIRELALGFYYRWETPGPRDWMDARREWKGYVRDKLKYSRHLDTELQVWNECVKACPTRWLNWRNIKNTFKPDPVAEWISDFALDACGKWLAGRTPADAGIVWIEHRDVGRRMTELGWSYFGAGDNSILDTKESGIVASIAAHGEGKNLERFSRNLIVSPPTSGKAWEQVIGRTHRPGQQADEVTCEVFLDVPECRESFEQARRDARYLEDSLGNVQKLNYATIIVDETEGRTEGSKKVAITKEIKKWDFEK